jgi:quercetin dioxygenase-like cupin family protein
MRSRTLLIGLTVGLIAAWSAVGLTAATAPAGVSSTTIATGNLDGVGFVVRNGRWMTQLRTKGQTDVAVVENRVAPGGSFGWHSHPGPSLIIVKQGTITFYRADDPTCTPEVYHQGDAFVDQGTDVHIGVNNGTEDLVVIVTRLLPDGAGSRDDAADPMTCGPQG